MRASGEYEGGQPAGRGTCFALPRCSARVAGAPIFRGVPGLCRGRCDLVRLFAGESDAGDRRERHCRNADQCCRSLGAADWGAMPLLVPAASIWPPMALPSENPTLRTTWLKLVAVEVSRLGDRRDDSGHCEWHADANTGTTARITMAPPPRRTSAPIRSRRRGVSLPETNPARRTALEPRQLQRC